MAGAAQRSCSLVVAFAGVLLGVCLCLAGALSPYWIKGEVSMGSLLDNLDVDSLIELDVGLFWFCYDIPLVESDCLRTGILHELNGFDRRIVMVQILAFVSVIVGLLCGVAALCKSSCCSKGKSVCHGILTFLAGAAGIAVVVFIQQDTELLVDPIPLKTSTYNWSFYLYVGGSSLVILVSFFLCCLSVGDKPEEMEPLAQHPNQ